MVMGGSMVVGLACGWVAMVMGESVVVGFDARIRWWVGRPMDGFRWMGPMNSAKKCNRACE